MFSFAPDGVKYTAAFSHLEVPKGEFRKVKVPGTEREFEVYCPISWSTNAVQIVVSRYFRKDDTSIFELVRRVVEALVEGAKDTRGLSDSSAHALVADLTKLLLNQYASFNSPVWFNVGVEAKPQCSACFILDVEDTMPAILQWYYDEGMIFSGGSGAGVNLSKLRGKDEGLSHGGHSSGPVSFMKGADASAGVIKSGGKTRRAAKMVILDVDHPDIEDFIECKVAEERKAQMLIAGGLDGGFASIGGAYESVSYQNANHSVRVTDTFMLAAREGQLFNLAGRVTNKGNREVDASELLNKIAKAAWSCGDPGIQFDGEIQRMHTCPESGRIEASNPCSEYLHLNNTACNLASLNLKKFISVDAEFNHSEFTSVCELFTFIMDVIVDISSYPVPAIDVRAREQRTLGLGFSNLGGMLMDLGVPYDSEEARMAAAVVSSLMTSTVYHLSALLANVYGTFDTYEGNREAMSVVVNTHRSRADAIKRKEVLPGFRNANTHAQRMWEVVCACAVHGGNGFRNAQATVIAPTGTISFMMDCDTTGCEPGFSLISHKTLVGGGTIKQVNSSVKAGLRRRGYCEGEVEELTNILETEGADKFKASLSLDCDRELFACANDISPRGHVDMMAAIQPFISGAISKTVNMPNGCTVDEVRDVYEYAWVQGIKCLAIYRDGSKGSQPLTTKNIVDVVKKLKQDELKPLKPLVSPHERERLPEIRNSVTRKFRLGNTTGFCTLGLYPDGRIGEVFININKSGSTIRGLADSWAKSVSVNLQLGWPVKRIYQMFVNSSFEPQGFTGDPDQPTASSIIDFVVRWMFKIEQRRQTTLDMSDGVDHEVLKKHVDSVFGECTECGGNTQRSGSCTTCIDCGSTTGCG